VPSIRHRYGLVLGLTLVLLLFAIAAPEADWARAVEVGLQSLALLAAVITAGSSPGVRNAAATASGIAFVLAAAAAATVGLPESAAVLVSATFAALTMVRLATGLVRSIRAHGVTHQEILGAIAVYLMLGGFFTFLIGTVAALDPSAFYVSGSDGSLSEHVYFSFTVLTTTGFGDFTAAAGSGRAVAVLGMLAGQIYMVTVISVLVSHLRGRLS
jgi:Ion channel